MTSEQDYRSPGVPHEARQGEETKPQREDRWDYVEPVIWTDRMIAALETGVKGGRWFSLMDKVYALRTLHAAWERVKRNRGAAGVDGQSIAAFEAQAERYLEELATALQSGRYRPQPVKRVWIDKPGSKEQRPLGIPTVKDRVVQTALKLALESIFEAGFGEQSYGFRPGRGCKDALRQVETLLQAGAVFVVDVDIQQYFDTIPQDRLVERVRARIADGQVLTLLERFLSQGVMEGLARWQPEAGTPQGAVISPLLANIYLDDLDQSLDRGGWQLVRYADDVRHITRRQIPFTERRGTEERTSGSTADLAAKAKGDRSMPVKRGRSEDAYGLVSQDPRDRVKAPLPEPQSPAMQAYILRSQRLGRSHSDRAAKSSSPEASAGWAVRNDRTQGDGQGTYVALDTSGTEGKWDRPPRREAHGDGAAIVLRGRESRLHGEGRQVL